MRCTHAKPFLLLVSLSVGFVASATWAQTSQRTRIQGNTEINATTENMTMAENSVDDQYVGGLKNISAIGRGQSATAQAGLGDIANTAASKATSDAVSAFNRKAGTINAVGSIAGAAAHQFKDQ